MIAPAPLRPHLAGTPILRTERLTLCAPDAGDWPAFRDFMLDERSRFVRDGDMDEEKAWRAFGHAVGIWVLRGFGAFVLRRHGGTRALGMAGPWFPQGWPEPEIAWWVWDGEAEGKGFAFEAAFATRAWAFDALGWATAVSYVHPDNARSAALARRLGATVDPDAAWADAETLVFRHPRPGPLREALA